MSPFTFPMASDAVEVVRRPHPADALGATLRGAYGCPAVSEDMARLLRLLDKVR